MMGNTVVLDPALELELNPDADLVPSVQDGKYSDLVREVVSLEAEDITSLHLDGPVRSQDGLKHIRAFHHIVALRLAAGEKPVQICATMSITPQTVTKLTQQPQFAQLVEDYREGVVQKTVDAFELMSIVNAESLAAIHERLVGENRDEIPLEALRRIMIDTADRTGHSPIRRSETLNRHEHALSGEAITRIKALHAENTAYEAEVVEAEIVATHEEDSADQGAGRSIADAFKPVAEDKTDADPSPGPSV
jgi:hypothetical protein